MTEKKHNRTLRSGSGSLVDGLARSVISQVSATPHQRRARRLEIASKVLYAAVSDNAAFDRAQVVADLAALRISRVDIVDICVPRVAAELGEDWVEDRLSFAAVTSASARLYGLCKSIGQNWDNVTPKASSKAILLVTLARESHIIGPAVVVDQLRRQGHSVQLHTNATAESMLEKLASDHFDAVLISVSTWQALDSAANATRKIKQNKNKALIVLGGAILNEDGFDVSLTDADMTTNDIDAALDSMTGTSVETRVEE